MSSAIDTTFHWVRNPTAINGLQTTYCSKRGSDVTGDGTEQNPYASLAKATSVATNGTNIMLDDGEWSESVANNDRAYRVFGNGKTTIVFSPFTGAINFYNSAFYFLKAQQIGNWGGYNGATFINCYLFGISKAGHTHIWVKNCICIECSFGYGAYSNNVCINCKINVDPNDYWLSLDWFIDSVNNIFYNCTISGNGEGKFPFAIFDYNNFCNNAIYSYKNTHSTNDNITGQTIADYFNKYDANDWLQCDFTAKAGSKNIGAGEKGSTIGLNQGYTMYADNSANDVFKESNGATLKNIAWDSNLNGYTLVQKERVCQGATSTTITLDSSASAVDDYYNNLFVGIVGGDGYGELFLITDYDGTTKTATIDGTWTTTPTTKSIYTISGTILSAVKDFGKVIKVKRNWTFADSFTTLADGQWAEFMTHVETNGKQFPVSCYSYEYSTDGVNFVQGQTADDLVSATNGENKVTDNIYGDCSANYNEATAKNLIMRYIRVRVHIGFNIGQLGE